jgi:hypothetical protein
MNVARKEYEEENLRDIKQKRKIQRGMTNFFISKKKKCIELDQLSESFGAVDTINSNCTTMLAEIFQEGNNVIMSNERAHNQRFVFKSASNHQLYCLLFVSHIFCHLFVIFRKKQSCSDIFNCVKGPLKEIIPLVHMCVSINPKQVMNILFMSAFQP